MSEIKGRYSALPAKVDDALEALDRDGYFLVRNVGGQRYAVNLLQEMGRLMPQYKGALEHEVTYRHGFDDMSYSQSTNTILAHTEAPGWNPSPRYLSLYCHQQATCGGGHTDLLDGKRLPELLSAEELALLTDHRIVFPGPQFRVDETDFVRTEMMSRTGDRMLLRFSYNLLTSGEYDPPLDFSPAQDALPLGERGANLATRVSDTFRAHCTPILIPDDALLIWDNQRMLHARSEYADRNRHLTRYWISDI